MITQPAPADASLARSPASALQPAERLLTPAGESLFRQLVINHRHRLYRFVVKHIGWGSDAEDLTQQAFVEAANSYATFKGDSELSTWLYADDPLGRIEVRAWIKPEALPKEESDLQRAARTLVVTLTDWAPAFNPLEVPQPDLGASIEDRPLGGLGLLFVRRTADSLSYRLRDAQTKHPANVITFTKRCAPAAD